MFSFFQKILDKSRMISKNIMKEKNKTYFCNEKVWGTYGPPPHSCGELGGSLGPPRPLQVPPGPLGHPDTDRETKHWGSSNILYNVNILILVYNKLIAIRPR